MNYSNPLKIKSLSFLPLLCMLACGKGGDNQQIPTTPIVPVATCVAGQPCLPGAITPIINQQVHFSGVVTLDGKDSTKHLIRDLASAMNGDYGYFCLFGCGPGADNNHGYLDLMAEPGPQGQVFYRVTLTLGQSTPSYFYNPKVATISGDAPLYNIANGTGSQIQLMSIHKFNIISSGVLLDGSVPSVPNVQIIVDDQYPTPPNVSFGTVNLYQQLF